MFIKILIIAVILVAGIVLIYPEETIQFSKGLTIQEKTEQNFMDLKDDKISETIEDVQDTLGEIYNKADTKIKDKINNPFGKT
ncbi:MAG TPA: hypothetical protein VD731_00305 [Nitrosopumilaceae archaeon]|nr:hypothetical protein [Nitrosopumilaceae archaeon]